MAETGKVAARQRNEAGFCVEQESPVFNQIKFLKLAVKTGLLWFVRVYQVWGREAQRTEASCCPGRPQRTFDFHCAICYQIWSTAPLIGFTSITLILPQFLWTWTTKKKKKKSDGCQWVRNWILQSKGAETLAYRKSFFPLKCIPGKGICFPPILRYEIVHSWGWGKWWYKSRPATWKRRLS